MSRFRLPVALVLTSLCGAALLVLVYQQAYTAPPDYDLFWLAMGCTFVPIWALILRYCKSRLVLTLLIPALGLCSYFPAFLRAPTRPVFGDALAHYLSVEDILRTGNIFAPNTVVPIVSDYPGLHTLTAALVSLSGSSIWDVAVALLAIFHIATLLAVYSIVISLSENIRAAAFAAVIYGLSPQFGFFDSQFAYESLAMPFFVWTVALLLLAHRASTARGRLVFSSLSLALGIACVITHHLTSYALAALLLVMSLMHLFTGERANARCTLGVGTAIAVAAVAWVLITNAPILTYLGYFPRTATSAIGPIIDHFLGLHPTSGAAAGSTPTRSLFTGSTLPIYERYAAYLVQLIAALAMAVALWRLRHYRSGALLALALLGLTYFLLLPLRFNLAGEEGAGRVSTYQWVGIAVIVSIGIFGDVARRPTRLHSVTRSTRPQRFLPALPNYLATVVILAACFVSLVGNYGSAVDPAMRFPGVFELNSSDGRDTPLEAVDLARKFLAEAGPGRAVASDTSTERVFQTYAFTSSLGAFPQWAFFVAGYSAAHLRALAYSVHLYAIVVDDRVLEDGGDPGVVPGYAPPNAPNITKASLMRLDRLPWLKVMFRTTHYVVLKVLQPGAGS